MGYLTYHTLEIISGDDHKTNWEQEISKSTTYESGIFEDEIKWYDCDRDMRKFSKKHPNVIFMISGSGEEKGDLWRSWYKNGKGFTSKAEIVYEEFSEEKLG